VLEFHPKLFRRTHVSLRKHQLHLVIAAELLTKQLVPNFICFDLQALLVGMAVDELLFERRKRLGQVWLQVEVAGGNRQNHMVFQRIHAQFAVVELGVVGAAESCQKTRSPQLFQLRMHRHHLLTHLQRHHFVRLNHVQRLLELRFGDAGKMWTK